MEIKFGNGNEFYTVEQEKYGHCYRWIFEKESLLAQGIDIENIPEEGIDEDLSWPIGGSNSSSTQIHKVSTEKEVKDFLFRDNTTEYEDPELVDIAEGITTIDTDDEFYDSITSKFVELFNIPEEELTRENSYLSRVEKMIEFIEQADVVSGIDYDDPFYGDSRNMCLSELEAIYEAFKNRKVLKELKDMVYSKLSCLAEDLWRKLNEKQIQEWFFH